MLHKLKPVPRGLLILAVVGALGYTAMQVDLSKILPKKEVAVQSTEVPVTVVKPSPSLATGNPAAAVVHIQEQNTAKRAADDAVAAATAAAQPAPNGLTAAPTPNAGLDAVLGAGKKK